MNETTIPARLVTEAFGGLRNGWRVRFGGRPAIVTRAVMSRSPWVDLIFTDRMDAPGYQPRAIGLNANDSRMEIDPADPQTAFGVALRLDAWEAAGDRYWWADDYLWERRWRDTEALANRVRQIGMDHAIRRSLGERVSPGTLMRLALADDLDTWELALPDGTFFYFGPEGDEGIDRIVSLANITDPGEALAAIYAEIVV